MRSVVRRLTRRAADEQGVYMVLFAIMIVALLTMVAVVIDLGDVRQSRRVTSEVADLAALAGGEELGGTTKDPVAACSTAFAYVKKNAPAFPLAAPDPCPGQMDADCDPGDAPATTTAGDYTVSIRYPVSPGLISDPRFPSGVGSQDGTLCERMLVSITRKTPTYFAGIIGVQDQTATATAVVRRQMGGAQVAPALWLLDPFGCTSLSVGGTGTNVSVGTPTIQGLITIDSNGSTCSGQNVTIDTNGGATLRALPATGANAGFIQLFAMPPGATACNASVEHDCDGSDVSGGNLSPLPVSRPDRATRAPVDHRFNCKSSYPAYHSIPITGCADALPTGKTPPHIDNLVAAVGTPGSAPAGFAVVQGPQCNKPPATINGNVWVNCTTFQVGNADNVTFTGGNVIFEGSIQMTGGTLNFNTANPATGLPAGCLATVTGCVGDSSQQAAWVFMRAGDLTVNGGSINLNRTAVYQTAGFVKMTGGAPPVWNPPAEGPLKGLALWSELATGQFQINGGANLNLAGTFFTPGAAPFSISGGSPVAQQSAQFVSFQLAISGGANLIMAPDPALAVPLPPPGPLLIR